MGKQKNTELNFLYLDDKYKKKKKKKNSNKPLVDKSKTKKTKKKNRADNMSALDNEDKFVFDNEIVIGVTKLPNSTTNKKNDKKKKNKKLQREKTNNKKTAKNSKNKGKIKTAKKENKKNIVIKQIIKWTILLSALAASLIFFMMSPLFNISQIEVIGNEKINTDTIISLSQIKLGENIYKISSRNTKKHIKENAYVDTVEIKRKLPNTMIISIKERITTFMLEYANSYAYINNQGYILEISQEKLGVPIIMGYSTKEENIKSGNRLCDDDLEKLGTVLKIFESANANGIANLITRINIQDKQNYILLMEEEKKTVYLGDASNLSSRMTYLKAILAGEKGIEGDILVNGDLNKKNAYFRRKE